jgi:hypothetical protein
MTHEPDAAGVVLIARIIKALFRWESVIRHFSTKGGGVLAGLDRQINPGLSPILSSSRTKSETVTVNNSSKTLPVAFWLGFQEEETRAARAGSMNRKIEVLTAL